MMYNFIKFPSKLPGEVLHSKDISNFKKFAFKQSIIEVSLALIIGSAFNNAVTAISSCLIMPIINYLLSHTAGNWRDYKYVPEPGLVLEIGKLLGSFTDFMLTAILLYIIYYKILKPLLNDIDKFGIKKKPTIHKQENSEWDNWNISS